MINIDLTPEPDIIYNVSVYRICLKYRYGKYDNSIYDFVEYVNVKDNENIEEVINSLKERLYYDWTEAPLIEGASYYKT